MNIFADSSIIVGLLAFGAVLFVGRPAQGQWVEVPGAGWVELQFSHQDTRTRYDENGRTEPFFNEEARAITTTLRFTGALGLWQGLDLWIDAPVHRLQFNDAVQDRLSTGPGDPRLFFRAGPGLLDVDPLPFPVALRGGVKVPVGDFDVDVEVIPLSEGQRDWELLLEMGHSFHPWPVYVMGWVGYRWREPNTRINRKPGDERLLYLAAGGSLGRFQWKVAFDGLFGRPPVRTSFNLPLEKDRRELIQLIPSIGWEIGPGVAQVGGRLPLHGRNLPAGAIFTLGYFLSWDAPLW